MPAIIEISQDDIAYSEKILLKEGEIFDDERVAFIKNFETIDLQAVPGSGKTTALLAKLLILEKKLPLANNRGVLILSHTNVAIDEIKEKIGDFCPKLFSYPNFIGTIQSFVDQFLAIPYYLKLHKKKPYRIDNEIYDERVLKTPLPFGAKSWIDRKREPNEFLKSIRFNTEMQLINGIDGKFENFELKNPESDTYRALKNMKIALLDSGCLHFDDAYFLANRAIQKAPKLIPIFQQRFQYVFVDEMQDMEKHQYNIIEKLFFDEGNSKSFFQRIGDLNQAIYSGKVGLDLIWQNRQVVLPINGSHRLTPALAELVNCLALNREEGFKVIGLRNGNLKPCIVIYSLDKIENVLPAFSNKIKECIEEGSILQADKNIYQAIGWTKEKEEGKVRIADYCNSYKASNAKSKVDYDTLDCYLKLFDTKKKSLKNVRKIILNAVIKVLRLEGITDTKYNRPFSKNQLINYLEINYTNEARDFKLRLFQWSIELVRGKFNNVHQEMKDYLPILLGIWVKTLSQAKSFVENVEADILAYSIEKKNTNDNNVNFDGFDIGIGTVHSAKGQTHTATLYMETFYERGKGNYESERLFEQFMFSDFKINALDIVNQTVKMAYVGFSRPTHLLCVAIQKDRFDKHLSKIDRNKWDLIEV